MAHPRARIVFSPSFQRHERLHEQREAREVPSLLLSRISGDLGSVEVVTAWGDGATRGVGSSQSALGRMSENLSLFEEEVPRRGVKVVRRFEYTRWVDGSTFLWLAPPEASRRGRRLERPQVRSDRGGLKTGRGDRRRASRMVTMVTLGVRSGSLVFGRVQG